LPPSDTDVFATILKFVSGLEEARSEKVKV